MFRIALESEPYTSVIHYRTRCVIKHCKTSLLKEGIELVEGMQPNCNAYFCHRLIRTGWKDLHTLRSMGVKLVAGFDDHPFDIPDSHPDKEKWKDRISEARAWINLATHITVTTGELAKTFPPDKKPTILPNLIDADDFLPSPKPSETILFAGSPSHYGDIRQIINPIDKISKNFPKYQWVFWGCWTPDRVHNLIHTPWIHMHQYFGKLRDLRPKIALCPLEDSEFNACKSNLKFLEMTMAGAACIVSRSPSFSCVANRYNGLVVEPGNEQAWMDAITELLTNKKFRKDMQRTAKDRVINNYSWQSPLKDEWMNFFRNLASKGG